MALISKNERAPKVFIQYNAKTGQLLTSEKDQATGQKTVTAHEGVSGSLVDVRIREDKGNAAANVDPHHKLELELEDAGVRYVVTINASVNQAVEAIARLNAADLGHPVYIGSYTVPAGSPSLKPEGKPLEDDLHGITVRQGNDFRQKIDPFYGADEAGKPLPRPSTVYVVDDNGARVKVKGKDVVDKEACEAARLEAVARMSFDIVNRLKGGTQQQGEGDGISADDAMKPDRPRG